MKKLLAVFLLVSLLAACVTLTTEGLRIGMTEQQVQDLKGPPSDINKTTTRGAVYEQWVYTNFGGYTMYLYFENHRLSGWQD